MGRLGASGLNTRAAIINKRPAARRGEMEKKMEVIKNCGGYAAMHVACAKNACVRWHDFNFKSWHVGIFAKTRHGLTLVGVVSPGSSPDTFTWWANCRGEFDAEICGTSLYSAPEDTAALPYHGSYRDFMGCVETAAAFLAENEDEDEDCELNEENYE